MKDYYKLTVYKKKNVIGHVTVELAKPDGTKIIRGLNNDWKEFRTKYETSLPNPEDFQKSHAVALTDGQGKKAAEYLNKTDRLVNEGKYTYNPATNNCDDFVQNTLDSAFGKGRITTNELYPELGKKISGASNGLRSFTDRSGEIIKGVSGDVAKALLPTPKAIDEAVKAGRGADLYGKLTDKDIKAYTVWKRDYQHDPSAAKFVEEYFSYKYGEKTDA